MATIKEIAARCGCSAATVSKALHGMPDIGIETKKRIQQVAREMGYVPNSAARTLRTNRSQTIGLLLFLRGTSVWEHEYFAQIAAGIHSVTEPAGYDLCPVSSDQKGVAGYYLEYCAHRGYDGVIIMSAGFEEPGLRQMVDGHIPMVTIDYSFPQLCSVEADNRYGMQEMVRYIIGCGHRRIAFIHGEDSNVTRTRLAAFHETCAKHGVHVPPEYIKPSVYRSAEDSARATRELLALPQRPTCIVFPDDYAYIGGRNVILDAGLRIPEDISVAGYDGIPLSELVRPKLTTVNQNAREIGVRTGEMMLKTIHAKGSFTPDHITVPSTFVKGESVSVIAP